MKVTYAKILPKLEIPTIVANDLSGEKVSAHSEKQMNIKSIHRYGNTIYLHKDGLMKLRVISCDDLSDLLESYSLLPTLKGIATAISKRAEELNAKVVVIRKGTSRNHDKVLFCELSL